MMTNTFDIGSLSLLVMTTITVAAVPVTHGYVGHRLHNDAWNTWRFKNIFFSGGKRFMVFQGLAWFFFAGALICVAVALGEDYSAARRAAQVEAMSGSRSVAGYFGKVRVTREDLFGASICSALISEVLMVSSLFTYHRGQSRRRHRRLPSLSIVYLSSTGTAVIASMCGALALAGTALLITAHHSYATPAARLIFTTLALACFAIAVPVTHGVGGRLKFAITGTWSFWQPGKGGVRFMLLQAFGWACFALSVAGCAVVAGVMLRTSSAALLRGGGEGMGDVGLKVVAAASWIAGISGFAAQILTACSLLHFQPRAAVHVAPAPAPASAPSREPGTTAGASPCSPSTPPGSPGGVAQLAAAAAEAAAMRPSSGAVDRMSGEGSSSWRGFLEMLLVLHVIHAPHLILLAIVATVLAAAPNLAWSAATFAVLAAAYSPTFLGAPGATGLRSWAAFQAWTTSVVEDATRRWHGECRVVRDGDAWHFHTDERGCGPEGAEDAAAGGGDAGAARRVVFGYHPHGMYPAAACWFHLTPQFASLFPSVPSPVTLGASVIFCIPLLRDVVMWSGARNVSRGVFLRSLRERGAVVLCPGGQAELVEHVGGKADDEVTLCTRHKGFIRIAIEEGAHLVPVVVFGESQATRNLIKWKAAQRWTYKRFGFPMPFLPGGFKGFLPIPAPLPLSFVVGEPVKVPPPGPDGRAAEADVQKVSEVYYQKIEDLFTRYKASSGFPNLRLVLKHD